MPYKDSSRTDSQALTGLLAIKIKDYTYYSYFIVLSLNTMSTDHHSGLADIKAVPSTIALIEESGLFLRGIPIQDLAEKAYFEEVVYLLWYERLPGRGELDRLMKEIKENHRLTQEITDVIYRLPREVHPQSILRHLISRLSIFDKDTDKEDRESRYKVALRILAKAPTLMCTYERYRKGKSMLDPLDELCFAENCLYMLWGEKPDDISTRAMNTCLILYAEHELNASTFAARVTTGTKADIYSAVVTAAGTLKGSLHGGANQKAMEMILSINDPESVTEWIDKKLEAKERIMGFGHRVYKKGDPRAIILRKLCKDICEQKGYQKYYEIAISIEEYISKKLNLLPNVDFFSALVLYALGFPIDTFTSVFTTSRISGWIAHILEQYKNNRLLRPRAEYTGTKRAKFIPLEKR